MSEAQLDAYKGVTNNIYNGSKKDQKMHVKDTKSPSEIFFYQEISMFWNEEICDSCLSKNFQLS
jgi:hypothetical protein